MSKLKIFCTSIKHYKIIDRLPSYITPIGLGENNFPSDWIDEKKGDNLFLNPENKDFKAIQITEEMNFQVWGVVTHIIHKV